jgi:hypothetical protein
MHGAKFSFYTAKRDQCITLPAPNKRQTGARQGDGGQARTLDRRY